MSTKERIRTIPGHFFSSFLWRLVCVNLVSGQVGHFTCVIFGLRIFNLVWGGVHQQTRYPLVQGVTFQPENTFHKVPFHQSPTLFQVVQGGSHWQGGKGEEGGGEEGEGKGREIRAEEENILASKVSG